MIRSHAGITLPLPGLVYPALLFIPWLLVVAWPGTVSLVQAMSGAVRDASPVDGSLPTIVVMRPMSAIVLETAAYASAVALLAVVFGWPAGRWLAEARSPGAALRRRLLLLLPVVTPAFVVFYTWWQAWPPGSRLFRWAVENELVTQLRAGTLVAGLVCWSWPLVAWCVAAGRWRQDRGCGDLLRLDGAGRFRRCAMALREDVRGMMVGGLLVFLLAFSNTTCFDLAQVYSVGNELRAIASLGAGPTEVLHASLPAVFLALTGGVIVWFALGGRGGRSHGVRTGRALPVSMVTLVGVLWVLSVLIPAVLLARGAGGARGVQLFLQLLARPMIDSALIALSLAAVLALVSVGALAAAAHPSRAVRRMLALCGATWMVMAALPGTTVAALVQSAFASGGDTFGPMLRGIAMSPVILVLGGLARFGVIAVFAARQIMAGDTTAARDCRLLDGVRGPVLTFVALRPMVVSVCAAAASVGWVLAFSEIPVTARLHPPGSDPLALRLLNAMHYQREESVMVACLLLLLCAAAAASVVMLLSARRAGAARHAAVRLCVLLPLCAVGLMQSGCTGPAEDVPAIRVLGSFGRPGISLGQFAYPRAIAADPAGGFVYVVDKTARIQKFDLEGRPLLQWSMPESFWGKPVGLSVHPDGRVFVADTHYHRVLAFTPDGEEVLRFGTFGEDAGEFIYPTDIAFLENGELFVAEYGGNDRIQVFDAEGRFLRMFGRFGRDAGELDRPQGILISGDPPELFVADACNHRLLVFDPFTGTFMRAIGGAGLGPGEVHYPYDICALADGTLLVAEFGNNRIQRFDPRDGRSLGMFGGLGTAEGRVQFPWGVARAGDRLFVLDSGNNRVQIMRAP